MRVLFVENNETFAQTVISAFMADLEVVVVGSVADIEAHDANASGARRHGEPLRELLPDRLEQRERPLPVVAYRAPHRSLLFHDRSSTTVARRAIGGARSNAVGTDTSNCSIRSRGAPPWSASS